MKIVTFGSKNWYSSQLDRIDLAFQELGHQLVINEKADLIYANGPEGFDDAIEYKNKFGGVLILNILDTPVHIPSFNSWIGITKQQLKNADYITSISRTTQKNVKKYLGFDSDVIFNPIKNVEYLPHQIKTFGFFFLGRLLDPNKRS
ncbi:MAG: hypothetical protein AABY22_34045, partial [Nanoarchaeota archaeon]